MQQFLRTSNFKWSDIKKTKKQTQQLSYSSHLNKETDNEREQNTKSQEKTPIRWYPVSVPPPTT